LLRSISKAFSIPRKAPVSALVTALALTTFLVAPSPAHAAWTSYREILWLKAQAGGVLVALDGFTLASYDTTTCADPGAAYLWFNASAQGFDIRFTQLLAAFHTGRKVNVSYYNCGNYSATVEYLAGASVVVSRDQ
jgi:hypothetical protein